MVLGEGRIDPPTRELADPPHAKHRGATPQVQGKRGRGRRRVCDAIRDSARYLENAT